MQIALTLIGAMLFPIGTLALLLWLTRLEETLPARVEAAKRRPAPPPILAMPVRGSEALAPVAPAVAPVVAIPEQRPAPAIEVVPAQREASAVLSLGGSTNL
jgi:hypothetical protein